MIAVYGRSDKKPIAVFHSDGGEFPECYFPKKQTEANAALVAAAPELLEAVKLFQKFFDTMPKGQFGKISCDIGLMNDALLKSSAAIAKAEERQ
jgi:hypothetical protein